MLDDDMNDFKEKYLLSGRSVYQISKVDIGRLQQKVISLQCIF